MATSSTAELESKLGAQQSDYLKRLQEGGNLPTVISDAWNKAGGAETQALRGQEGDLLKNYVSAGANNRAKYADVADPFARDKLAANQTAMDYSPVADVRKELAMRADALGVATNAAVGSFNAGTETAKTNLGFTSDAYSRALQREQEVQRQKEVAQSASRSASENAAQRAFTASENQKTRDANAENKTFKGPTGWKFKANEDGGLDFSNAAGNAVTAAQYVNSGGGTFKDLVSILSQSTDPMDQQIIQAINSGVSQNELKNRWPYVFGGV